MSEDSARELVPFTRLDRGDGPIKNFAPMPVPSDTEEVAVPKEQDESVTESVGSPTEEQEEEARLASEALRAELDAGSESGPSSSPTAPTTPLPPSSPDSSSAPKTG